ncbi:MAG: hypothetical protein LBC13_03980 [Clostridiales bacterium]|jgi:hypothetical protein|nr:hypothetical protein [Clostridiales bacterium]
MNPFNEKPMRLEESFLDWKTMYPKSYDKNEVDPYTKCRIILMNGAEYEAVWNSHHFHRHCVNQDIRRELALVRKQEQQQQKRVACLKPIDESLLETTISYEQLAVDLTACMARSEKDKYVKKALDFALLEDFDHLYRYADLLEMEHGVRAEQLVGGYTEIMPGRPTISEHRHPFDDVKRGVNFKTADPLTKLHVSIITAAEQQTMNYYMNQASFYTSDLGRKLYGEIALIEEQHVSHYGSLMDGNCTFLESLLQHEYTECYLYYSCYVDETDKNVKKLWGEHYLQEVAHLHRAAYLLEKYEKKHWSQVIPIGEFPELLQLGPNKEYIRGVMNSVELTAEFEDYSDVKELPRDFRFFAYQSAVNSKPADVASHSTIAKYIKNNGKDYRFEDAPHPVPLLRKRNNDNITVGRE